VRKKAFLNERFSREIMYLLHLIQKMRLRERGLKRMSLQYLKMKIKKF